MSGRSSARRHRFHLHAAAEYVEAAECLTAEDRQVAQAFEAAVQHAIDRIRESPEVGVCTEVVHARDRQRRSQAEPGGGNGRDEGNQRGP